MVELTEIVRIVWPAFAIYAGIHAISTAVMAHDRHKLTQEYYPNKGLLERMPRCIAKRIIRPETIKYTAEFGTIATIMYYILRNI